jgi:hypothetical protein
LQQILIKKRHDYSFKRLFLGILTGNEQLKKAVDPGEGFMDLWKSSFTTNDCLYFYRWTGKKEN